MRHPTREHCAHGVHRRELAAGSKARADLGCRRAAPPGHGRQGFLCAGCGQAGGSAFRRVVRRFGAAVSVASEGAATVSPVTRSPLAAEADAFVRERVVVALRVVVRFATVGAEAPDVSASAAVVSPAAVRRVRRAAGLASAITGALSIPLSAPAEAASAPERRPRVEVRRADPVEPDAAATDSGAASSASCSGAGAAGRAGAGLEPIWARSIASISGDTSLHGSSPDGRGAGRCGWRNGCRSPRF